MEKLIDKVFSLKTFPGKLVFVIWVSSAILVFFPQGWLEKLSLYTFKNKFEEFIGPTFLISSAIMSYIIYRAIADLINIKIYSKRRKNAILSYLAKLNWNEIVVLREFYIQGKDTIKAPISDETVIALENKGLIHKAARSAVVGIDMAFPYAINQFARENITMDILHIPVPFNEMDETVIKKIYGERPHWAVDIERRENLFRGLWY
ncbi:super-infection exclusion protein B [Elizabethkingia anophelis]|uniref:super-infection exclusion protein B n=1 Tax=Elizabethkingia anophelis TaxID=1117645 RepID=UPI0012B413E0|nr:super-infection exclusion protein B [Elizabethkingia anophelis]QGN22552.1 hypothetical protein GJV56_07875 [Elizabethkingia anophelis]QNV09204.1 hypothetical protein EIY88_07855 [Elizabethkingia anophelis]UTF90960.1 superinfection exclusion B family protein [Elizabethkingia anophelis]UTG01830.1 superinfection exclusion B family protein [Elizabethkingia anophelis]UTG05580.1 superinfection exclusion B family protein [Elizabethkingia anophelis]